MFAPHTSSSSPNKLIGDLLCCCNPPQVNGEPRKGGLKVNFLTDEKQLQPTKSECAVTVVRLLKACNDIGRVSQLHADIRMRKTLENNPYVASALISMYARVGALGKAQEVLDELSVRARDVVTWTALIAGYAQQGKGKEALKCFDRMQQEGHSPNLVTFTCALKACGIIGAIARGEQIHHKIVSLGMLEKGIVLGNTLVDMYAKCGALARAQQVFNEIPVGVRNVVTWTALLAAYTQQGRGTEALKCFEDMRYEGHFPDAITFACALKACGSIGAVAKGEQIHNEIVSLGMLEKDIVLRNALVDMYARCGILAKAQEVFSELPVQDVDTFTALIAGYTQNGQSEQALDCFDRMQREGCCPNSLTFICALKACGSIGAVTEGEQIHNEIASLGMLEENIVLGSSLVGMYARCGALQKAQQLFDELPLRNVVTWTALIAGYAQQGQGEEALKCFDNMQHEGHFPNAVTFTCALKACGSIGAVTRGEQIHKETVSLGMLEGNIVLGSTLVDMYAKCDALPKAQQVFNELSMRNMVTWNALIAGYVQQGQGEETLKWFDSMQSEGHSPNVITFTCALKACGSLGATAKGEQIHDKIVSLGLLEEHLVLANALIDMYAKCGALLKAQQVFNELLARDVVTWTSLIAAYAQQGQGEEALECFERMQSKEVRPSLATLVCVLNASSHTGLLDQAKMQFLGMTIKYGLKPDVEHFCCMVGLFGRAGKLDKALEQIDKMCADYLPLWRALLGACFKWGDVKVGRLSYEHALLLDKSDATVYICMANIYEGIGMQDDADKIEAAAMANNALMPRCWWSDDLGESHSF